MEKLLKIYTYVDGVNDTPFPNADAQIEIFSFNYDAKRMGGAPTISTSVMYKDCLDKLWTGKEYVRYNGERYKLKQTPTSSKSNTDARYKHDLELVALRVVLDYVYFFDAVVDNTPVDDKPVTNNTKVVFSGDIHEFAKRLNASLKYTKLDYSVVVDEGITSDTKFLSFDAQPFSSVLQEIYKQYEIPYYFVGKVIHIGYTSNTITTPFKYGAEDALLSISKNNSNNKIVNRCTGVGAVENIPYYYPNESALGVIKALYNKEVNSNLSIYDEGKFKEQYKSGLTFTQKKEDFTPILYEFKYYTYQQFRRWIEDYKDFFLQRFNLINTAVEGYIGHWFLPDYCRNSNEGKLDGNSGINTLARLVWKSTGMSTFQDENPNLGMYNNFNEVTDSIFFRKSFEGSSSTKDISLEDNLGYYIKFKVDTNGSNFIKFNCNITGLESLNLTYRFFVSYFDTIAGKCIHRDVTSGVDSIYLEAAGGYVYLVIEATKDTPKCIETVFGKVDVYVESYEASEVYNWFDQKGSRKFLKDYGISYNGDSKEGDVISFEVGRSLIPIQETLMPPIYRNSGGAECFYNAKNYPFKPYEGYVLDTLSGDYIGGDSLVHNDNYINPATNNYYEFKNEYSENNRKEHKETFDWIKPTIANIVNDVSLPINMFLEFAYDENDSDEVNEKGKYSHPYFFAKLRKFDGEYGFNLFSHISEKGEMTISMTSGNCGACNFVIVVDEKNKKNTVQVNNNGTLVRDEKGNVVFGEALEAQNDTINNEVWIALKKDNSTFPHIMPNKTFDYKPKSCSDKESVDGDTFVIVNSLFPNSYIFAAEQKLCSEIIRYMWLNNKEIFSFSIKFSRIFLAENPDILAQLNENSTTQIEYNGERYELYVSSYQYKVSEGEALPEITVELVDTLFTNETAIQQALSAVEHNILSNVNSIDFFKQGLRYFIRKDVEDYVKGLIHLQKGATFGVDDIASIDEDGNAKIVSQIVRQFITTPVFLDGFAGEGFKIWLDENGLSNLTIDNITVRQSFRVFEMIISRLRAVNGGLLISAANGVIHDVFESDDGDYYEIQIEDNNSFVEGDFVRCQTMSGTEIFDWWVEVQAVSGNIIKVLKSEFNGSMPTKGQEIVLLGSKNINRQNAIHISASDDGQPRIDILNNISSKSLVGCLRTRLGNLDGIYNEAFGDKQPHGEGLYGDNVFLKGEFVSAIRGKSIDTLFDIQDGKIQSSIAQTQNEAIKGKTFLYNASFTKGFDGWVTSNDEDLYISEDNLLLDGESAFKNSVNIFSEPTFDDVFVVNINNGWIKQPNWIFVDKPEFDNTKQYPLFFSCNIRCKTIGTLLVKIGDKELFNGTISQSDNFISLDISKTSDDKELTWDGGGDFYLSFSGVADFYGLTIYSEKTEVRYATLFEQTDRLISLTAAVYDKDQSKLKETGLLVRPDKAGLFAVGNDGSYAQIGVYPEDGGKVVLSGDHIILEGNVTANNGLFVDNKGLVTMYNAKFLTEGDDKVCLNLDNNGLVIKEDLGNEDYEDMLRILVEKEVGYLKRNAPKIQLIKKVKTSDFQRQNILNLLANQINFTTSDYEYSDIGELGTRIRQSGLFVSVIEDGTTVQLMLAKGGSTGWDNTVTINPYSILTPDLNTGTLTLGGKQVVSITKDEIDYLILKKQ